MISTALRVKSFIYNYFIIYHFIMLFYSLLFIYEAPTTQLVLYTVSPMGTRPQKSESADSIFRELTLQPERIVKEQLNTESLITG